MTCPGKKVEQSELSPVTQARLTRPMGTYVPFRAVLDSMTDGVFADITEESLRDDPKRLEK